MRYFFLLGLMLILSGCVNERHFAADALWPFGNPNAPRNSSEDAQRALGKTQAVTPISPQAGDVWPGPVRPMPTLGQMQKDTNLPLGQAYIPSLPSPYPPGQGPGVDSSASVPAVGGSLYSVQPGASAQILKPARGD